MFPDTAAHVAIITGLRGSPCRFPSPSEPPLDPSLYPPLECHRHHVPRALPTIIAIIDLLDLPLLAIPSTTMILLEMPHHCPISLIQAPELNLPSSRSSPVPTTIRVAIMLPPCSLPSSHLPPISVPMPPCSRPSLITISLIHHCLHHRPNPFESLSRAVTSSPLQSRASRHLSLAIHCSLHLLPAGLRSLQEPVGHHPIPSATHARCLSAPPV